MGVSNSYNHLVFPPQIAQIYAEIKSAIISEMQTSHKKINVNKSAGDNF